MKLKQIRVSGYKNLVDCVVDLDDFNVIVGPNNSGKTNLLEALQILGPLFWGSQEIRNVILAGGTPREIGTSICHLDKYLGELLQIGLSFEIAEPEVGIWLVDYSIKVKTDAENEEKRGIVSEQLNAKVAGTPGKAVNYFTREFDEVRIGTKTHPISVNNSVFNLIQTLYPKGPGSDLPDELFNFIGAIAFFSATQIFAYSPDLLRDSLGEGESETQLRIVYEDIISMMKKLSEDSGKFDSFREIVCETIGIEDIVLESTQIPVPERGRGKSETMYFCYAKDYGSEYSLLGEYSDGTLMIVAIVASVLLAKKPIVFLEEPENCLHPAALKHLVDFLRNESGVQVLMTTHSPYLLNFVSPYNVIVSSIGEDGAADFDKIKDKKAVNALLNNKYMNLGDLLASNFEDLLGAK